jgi:hypothetical protein
MHLLHLKSPNGLLIKKNMFLLTDLTEDGFRQIRNDRDELLKKIRHYQDIVDEFETVIPFLEAIYEPKVEITFNDKIQFYVAKCSVPYQGKKVHLNIKLGKKDMFDGFEDPKLIESAQSKIKKELERQFPLHFNSK